MTGRSVRVLPVPVFAYRKSNRSRPTAWMILSDGIGRYSERRARIVALFDTQIREGE